jgi:uncharacterized membrane protein YoaK (UPF0700 family)
MFIHHGKKRTYKHNLQIASLLSFVAGLVNVAGFLAVATLTTNVTGHFAFFVDEVFKLKLWNGLIYFLYIFCYFAGSLFSSFIVELLGRRAARHNYIVPTAIESLLLMLIAVLPDDIVVKHAHLIAYTLLFAMGMQNSLVSRISNATVRTTHLTGLFTDLGIELSQLFFYKRPEIRKKLTSNILLRISIISFFFAGGVTGGVFYSCIGLSVLWLGVAALVFGMFYDNLLLQAKLARRKYRQHQSESE